MTIESDKTTLSEISGGGAASSVIDCSSGKLILDGCTIRYILLDGSTTNDYSLIKINPSKG